MGEKQKVTVGKHAYYPALRDYYEGEHLDKLVYEEFDPKKLNYLGKEIYGKIRKYFHRYILLPIIVYGSLRMIRPHFSYVVPYLENECLFDKSDVEMWGIFTQYAMFVAGIPILGGLIGMDGDSGLRVIILVEVIFQLYARISFVFVKAPQFWWMLSIFAATGLAFAAESFIFAYRVHIIDMHFNQQTVSLTSASFYFFAFLSGLISRFVLAYHGMQYLFFISIGMVFVSFTVAYITFPSIYRRMNYCFDYLPLTMKQLMGAEGFCSAKEHLTPEEKKQKDQFIHCKKEGRKCDPNWDSSSNWQKPGLIVIYIWTRESGLFWTLAWVIATVCQWVIHAEMPMRWLDISKDSENNGLMDGLSSLGAMVGSLIPWFLEKSLPDHYPRCFCMIGLAVISTLIYCLSVVNDINISYALFITYQLIVTWMLSFISCKWTNVVRTEDQQGQVVMFIAVFMIALVVIGLQIPVRLCWQLTATNDRLMFYFKVIAGLSCLCYLLVPCSMESKDKKPSAEDGIQPIPGPKTASITLL